MKITGTLYRSEIGTSGWLVRTAEDVVYHLVGEVEPTGELMGSIVEVTGELYDGVTMLMVGTPFEHTEISKVEDGASEG